MAKLIRDIEEMKLALSSGNVPTYAFGIKCQWIYQKEKHGELDAYFEGSESWCMLNNVNCNVNLLALL